MAKTLVVFNMASETTKGEVTLSTNGNGMEKDTCFNILDREIGYNAILRKLWIHVMRAVPLTYHQVLNFPSPIGIMSIRGDLTVAREMNIVSPIGSPMLETPNLEKQESTLRKHPFKGSHVQVTDTPRLPPNNTGTEVVPLLGRKGQVCWRRVGEGERKVRITGVNGFAGADEKEGGEKKRREIGGYFAT
ncbi:hypothetical protein HAX54_017393 [Datura stramonium]|uniref:Uncharacterized protein n=1 Tax=Datura stramonium TaxID=4076 RepID=A0ABS8ULC2_DATST|nr:hypothetical protein [Datura stramonium]